MRQVIALILSLLATNIALSKEIAVCGASAGYAYYPAAGPLAEIGEKGEWVKDGISLGRITLTAEQDRFDLLYVDASGAIVSATSDGGTVTRMGQTDKAISVAVSYPGKTIETWTFINSSDGPEAIWSSNKYGTAIPKIAAFRAGRSQFSSGLFLRLIPGVNFINRPGRALQRSPLTTLGRAFSGALWASY